MVSDLAISGLEAGEGELERVLAAHFDDVYRIVRHLLGPSAARADVDDVAQLVFLQIQRALPAFRGESQTSTWIYGIASRVVLAELRSWRRRFRFKKQLALEVTESPQRTPEQAAAQRQQLLLVWSAVERLSPKKRMVYVLHEIEGLSGPEISTALSIPEGTVWTRLHHARREVITRLEKRMRERLP